MDSTKPKKIRKKVTPKPKLKKEKTISGGRKFKSLEHEFVACYKFVKSMGGRKVLHPKVHLNLFGLALQAAHGSYSDFLSDDLDLEFM